jgi:hypothetical protein
VKGTPKTETPWFLPCACLRNPTPFLVARPRRSADRTANQQNHNRMVRVRGRKFSQGGGSRANSLGQAPNQNRLSLPTYVWPFLENRFLPEPAPPVPAPVNVAVS